METTFKKIIGMGVVAALWLVVHIIRKFAKKHKE